MDSVGGSVVSWSRLPSLVKGRTPFPQYRLDEETGVRTSCVTTESLSDTTLTTRGPVTSDVRCVDTLRREVPGVGVVDRLTDRVSSTSCYRLIMCLFNDTRNVLSYSSFSSV